MESGAVVALGAWISASKRRNSMLFASLMAYAVGTALIVARLADSQTCEPAVEEVRIGAMASGDHDEFVQIRAITADRSGTIYVLDQHPASIREYDREGSLVRWIGQEGQGPGEYRLPAGLSVVPDGQLAVWDRGNRRINVYDAEGKVERSIRVAGSAPYVQRAFQTDIVGSFYVRIFIERPRMAEDGRHLTASPYGYLQIDSDGVVIDTLAEPAPEGPEVPEPMAILTHSGYRSPFPSETIYALSPFGHFVTGSNHDYVFTIHDSNGSVEIRREDFRRVPVARGEGAEWRERIAWAERRSGIRFRPVPAWKPAYRNLLVDSDGRIWVHLYQRAVRRDAPIPEIVGGGSRPRIRWWEASVFDIYDSGGRFLRCIGFPDHSEVMASVGPWAWGVVRGPLAEEYVVRWRID